MVGVQFEWGDVMRSEKRRSVLRELGFCLAVAGLLCPELLFAAGKRYALVVGVETYRPNQPLPKLSYTESDADALAAVLKKGGYQVTLMTQTFAKQEGKEVYNPLSDYIRDQDGPDQASLTVVLAHGAGAGMDTEFMNLVAAGIADAGFGVVRFEFPYMTKRRETGQKRPPDREPILREAWHEVIQSILLKKW